MTFVRSAEGGAHADPGTGAGTGEGAREEAVAIFGGSFNPPHVGHVLLTAWVLALEPVDRVVVVPVFHHPFAKDLAPFEHRFAMCELAFAGIRGVSVSTIERDLGGDSLTLRTLQRFAADSPTWRMRLVIGSDVVADLDKWHRWDLVEKLAPPLVVPRAGAGTPPGKAVLPEVSSTDVRAHFRDRDAGGLRRMVPRRVVEYALAHDLYAPRVAKAK
ncbi:MAG: nicotinate-nicotinamide nucleotide adenylyltransferase [Polyangiaceae bacterium]